MKNLAFAAGVTVLYTTFAMWARQPSSSCVMTEEPHQRLYMDRQVHREHLARDVHRLRQSARRHAAHEDNATTETQPAEPCLDTLARQLASTHDVSIDTVRRLISEQH